MLSLISLISSSFLFVRFREDRALIGDRPFPLHVPVKDIARSSGPRTCKQYNRFNVSRRSLSGKTSFRFCARRFSCPRGITICTGGRGGGGGESPLLFPLYFDHAKPYCPPSSSFLKTHVRFSLAIFGKYARGSVLRLSFFYFTFIVVRPIVFSPSLRGRAKETA